MELRECSPCFDCGHEPNEIEHFNNNEHEYYVVKVFGLEIQLCDFCDADFGSYNPSYFGLKEGPVEKHMSASFSDKISKPVIEKDYVCQQCSHRLKFLEFLKKARDINGKGV
jgi:DNA-directed RNA polymerase subunit RPC12/RpoP